VVAGSGRPWAVVITAFVAALVAAGALATAATMRDRGESGAETDTTETATTTTGVGVDGCLVRPCQVLADMPVGATRVQLVADAGGASGRLRIGGAGSSDVIELSITAMGAVLGPDSLQCMAATQSACLVKGMSDLGVVGQVIVGRTGKWNQLAQPFQSDAGYLGLADIASDNKAEVLVAQHDCDPATTADCATTEVYVRVYDLRSQELGCTRNYRPLDKLPGWPQVTFDAKAMRPCG
jgi:hypothetical protein